MTGYQPTILLAAGARRAELGARGCADKAVQRGIINACAEVVKLDFNIFIIYELLTFSGKSNYIRLLPFCSTGLRAL